MKNLNVLWDANGVVAVYDHVIAGEHVPIVIVDNDSSRKELEVHDVHRIIVLMADEVHRSHDVFALQFVYMQAKATLVSGEDVLWSVHIDSGHLRRHIELLLRQVIIDWREFELTNGGNLGSYETESVLDRLGVGLSKLLDVSVDDVWGYIDQKLGTDFGIQSCMYENYEALLVFVDEFEEK